MTGVDMMTQTAPYPDVLADLVNGLAYRENQGWRVWLADIERDPGSAGLTLIVQRHGPDSYHPPDPFLVENALMAVNQAPGDLAALQALAAAVRTEREQAITVNHYFPVTPATFDEQSWRRWLFDRLGDVDDHERQEDFIIGGIRPYAPVHKPGANPYIVRELATDLDRRTSFRGTVKPS